jgi:hypothetical protein
MKAEDNTKASLQAAIAMIALAVVTAACSARSAKRYRRHHGNCHGSQAVNDYMAQCTKRYGMIPKLPVTERDCGLAVNSFDDCALRSEI